MATETLRPSAAGDETDISQQIPASTFHWDKVDEAEADDETTYVAEIYGSYHRDLYNLPASSGSGTINFVKIYIKCKADGTGYAKPSLKSNSTVTDGTEIGTDTDWTTYSQQWNTNPADSEAWEWADIDALQIGVSLKAYNKSKCTQVYVEVDYTPPVEQAVGGGAIAIAGALGRKIFVTRGEGSIAIAGLLNRKTSKAVGDGSIAIAGALNRLIKITVGGGAIGIAGTLVWKFVQAVGGGSVGMAGTLASILIGRVLKVVAITSQYRSVGVITSQFRLIKTIIAQYRGLTIITAQNRLVKPITAMYRRVKSFTGG